MSDDHAVTIAVVGVLGLVALVGLFLFAIRSPASSTGSIAVLDPEGRLLYTVSDQPRRIVGQVPFEPAGS